MEEEEDEEQRELSDLVLAKLQLSANNSDHFERFKGDSMLSFSYNLSSSLLPDTGSSFITALSHSLSTSSNTSYLTSPNKDKDTPTLYPTTARNPNKALITINATSSVILVANNVAEHLFEYPSGQLVGMKIDRLFDEPYSTKQRALVESNINQSGEMVLVSGKVMDGLTANGVSFPVSVWMKRVSSGENQRVIVVIEPAIRSVANFVISQEGIILACDECFATLFGYDEETCYEMIDQQLTVLIPSIILPQTAEEAKQKQLLTGRTKDSTPFPLTVHFKESLDDSQSDQLLSYLLKGTIIVYASLSGMVSFFPSGAIHGCNHHFTLMLLGYTQQELIGKDITLLIPDFYTLISSGMIPTNDHSFSDSDDEEEHLVFPSVSEKSVSVDFSFDMVHLPSISEDVFEDIEEDEKEKEEKEEKGVVIQFLPGAVSIGDEVYNYSSSSSGSTPHSMHDLISPHSSSENNITTPNLTSPESAKPLTPENKEVPIHCTSPITCICPHTNTICTSPHTHTTSPHTHITIPPPYSTISPTDINPLAHTTSPHTHTTIPSTHTTSPHTHTASPHAHTASPHAHTTSPHTHTTISPTHTAIPNTYTTSSHTHTTSPDISTLNVISHTTSPHTDTTIPPAHTAIHHTCTTSPLGHTTSPDTSTRYVISHTTSPHTIQPYNCAIVSVPTIQADAPEIFISHPSTSSMADSDTNCSTQSITQTDSHAIDQTEAKIDSQIDDIYMYNTENESTVMSSHRRSPLGVKGGSGQPSAVSTPAQCNSRPVSRLSSTVSGTGDIIFTGFAKHKDSSLIPVVLQFKQITLDNEHILYCVWLSHDSQKTRPTHLPRATPDINTQFSPDTSLLSNDLQQQHHDEDILACAGEYETNYETLRPIGRGAFGFVKLASRRDDGSLVVVKFIRKATVIPDHWVEHEYMGLVTQEICILSQIVHVNIVQLLEAYENDHYFQLVMEKHGDGIDLFTFIEGGPSLDEPLISYMFRQVVAALAYLHERKILHRDVKDENIILNDQFHLKLIDFGSAAYMKENCLFNTFCGTIEYCSPEVLLGNSYAGPELEMWSLGVTLYTLVFGENPFFDVDEIIVGHLQPPFLVSPGLMKTQLRLLHPDPKSRATLTDLQNDKWVNQPVDIKKYSFNVVRKGVCRDLTEDLGPVSPSKLSHSFRKQYLLPRSFT